MIRDKKRNIEISTSALKHEKSIYSNRRSNDKQEKMGYSRSISRKRYMSEVTSSKESAINFLKTVGIIDKNGVLASVYR